VDLNTDLQDLITVLCGVAIVVGILGTVVPMLPGVLLCWTSVLVWALFAGEGPARWVVLGIATVVGLVGVVAEYAWPGKRLKQAGVPTLTLMAGGLVGIIAFCLLPVFGLPIGFVGGVWLAELIRLREPGPAWASTKHALKAAGLFLLIEIASAITIGGVWLGGVLLT
jgi:uncharacterized protein YqgC (DUF456 family)